MKVSELCKMIEDFIHSGRYPLETETQKKFAVTLQVLNKSDSEDLHDAANIEIESRVQDLYVVNNYIPNILHLPGAIEMDVIDSFKMMCRKLDMVDRGLHLN